MKLADAAMLIAILALAWSFYKAQKDLSNVFNLFDLVMSEGRLNRIAVAFMATLIATTWVIVRLTLDGKLTEGYFTGYGLMWVAPVVAKLFSAPPPAGSVTTDTSSKTVIKTEDKP